MFSVTYENKLLNSCLIKLLKSVYITMQKRFEEIVNNRYNGELEKAITAFF